MAVNRCNFCDKRLAKETRICPNCGQDQKRHIGLLKVGLIMALPALLFVVVIPFGIKAVSSGLSGLTNSTPKISTKNSIGDLFGSFSGDKKSKENKNVDSDQLNDLAAGLLGSFGGDKESLDTLGGLMTSAIEVGQDEESLKAVYKSMGYSDKQIKEMLQLASGSSVAGEEAMNLLGSLFSSESEVNSSGSSVSNSGKKLTPQGAFLGNSDFLYNYGDPMKFPNQYTYKINNVEDLGNKIEPGRSTNGRFIKVNYTMKNDSGTTYDLYNYITFMAPSLSDGENNSYIIDKNSKHLSTKEQCPSSTSLLPGETKEFTAIYEYSGKSKVIMVTLEGDSLGGGVIFSF
jgi:hypothetical protein